MGLFDAMNHLVEGIILAVIIGAVIVALYPILAIYFLNATVFPTGLVAMGILGLIPLVWVWNVIQGMIKKGAKRELEDYENV